MGWKLGSHITNTQPELHCWHLQTVQKVLMHAKPKTSDIISPSLVQKSAICLHQPDTWKLSLTNTLD